MAGLAGGGYGFFIEGKRRLASEGGVLPLVVDGEGAKPLVAIEHGGERGFVTGGAELGLAVEGLHDGGGVTIEVGEDLRVGDGAVDGLAVFIHHDGGLGEDVASGSVFVDRLDGVADHAGDAVLVVGAGARGAVGEASCGDDGGIVAAFAVTRKADSLFVVHHVHVA